MRIGIFADIHSNLEALKSVFSDMENNGIETKICLGDIVGYGANPNECIDLIKNSVELTILGNHDSVAVEMDNSENFNPYALKAMEWTRKVLSDSNVEYLKSLPYKDVRYDTLFVHSSPKSPADWFYVSSLDDAVDAFEFFSQQICFIGHTHCPIIVVKESDQSFRVLEESDYTIQSNEQILVNVGSVGQPRDRIADASYCILDTESRSVELKRVKYNIESTQEAMQGAELPEYLIQRIAEGR